LSTWVTTRRWLDTRYTNKVHGTSGVIPSCGVVLSPSLDVGIIVVPVGVIDERSRWSLSLLLLLLLLLGIRQGLGVGGICMLWVAGAIELSLSGRILLSLSWVGRLALGLKLRLGMGVGLRLGDSRLGDSRLYVRSGVLLLRYGLAPSQWVYYGNSGKRN
jgi:hypothetical protein